MSIDLNKYLSVDPEIQHGKPCFRGTRIPVYLVLELLEAGKAPSEIAGKDFYPELSPEHVKAALRFAADYAKNQEYLDFGKTS
jgi:uncharacterized protein (DUF433 family)